MFVFNCEATIVSFEELSPLLQELTQNHVAFLGGFVAGALRLDLSDDPVKSLLHQQGSDVTAASSGPSNTGRGPQSISID